MAQPLAVSRPPQINCLDPAQPERGSLIAVRVRPTASSPTPPSVRSHPHTRSFTPPLSLLTFSFAGPDPPSALRRHVTPTPSFALRPSAPPSLPAPSIHSALTSPSHPPLSFSLSLCVSLLFFLRSRPPSAVSRLGAGPSPLRPRRRSARPSALALRPAFARAAGWPADARRLPLPARGHWAASLSPPRPTPPAARRHTRAAPLDPSALRS